MNSNCTKAITECLCNQWITNTTLMVNMPSTEEAVDVARRNNLLDHIGLHLNFTEGQPLTSRMKGCAEFCDEKGYFNWHFRTGRVHGLTPLTRQQQEILAEETDAQVRRYLELGLTVRHFDAHHHSHLVFRVMPIVFDIAQKYGFKTVRRTVDMRAWGKLRSQLYYPLNSSMKMRQVRRFGFVTTDHFGALADLRDYFRKLRNGDTVELMVHPMYLKNGALDMTGEMSDSGLRLMHETIDFVESHGAEMEKISFKELYDGRQ